MKTTKHTQAFYTGSDSAITVATGSAIAFVSAFALSILSVLYAIL